MKESFRFPVFNGFNNEIFGEYILIYSKIVLD